MVDKEQMHTLMMWAQDRPGVLNRVVSLCRKRRFNIHSLTVGTTIRPGITLMTFIISGGSLQQVVQQIDRLVEIVGIKATQPSQIIAREMALVKMKDEKKHAKEIAQLMEKYDAREHVCKKGYCLYEVVAREKDVTKFLLEVRSLGALQWSRSGVVAIEK